MLSRIYLLPFLLTFTYCSSFKTEKLSESSMERLISSLRGVGEGRGRLSVPPQQYVFSYEAVLKESTDWLLAVSIPLHGEEILLLPNLKEENAEIEGEGFGSRIEQAVAGYLHSQKESQELTAKFLSELRSIMRFVLHRELKKTIECEEKSNIQICRMDETSYRVSLLNNRLIIKKDISDRHQLELVAENLTGSFFSKTSIYLHSQKSISLGTPMLSLELFWK
jgi:hypothetical protein